MKPIVIIGSGLAGYTLAREFRKLDRETPLAIVSRDDASFYSKPMLSNALASGKSAAQIASARAAAMAEQLGARVLANAEVRAIDTALKTARVGDEALAYSSLVLALGADPIRVPLQGDAAGRVLQVNDLQDYARFRDAIAGKRRVAILGAGLIGCEFANDLAAAGYEVDVIDPAPQPLGRLLPPAAAAYVAERLAGIGIRWHFGATAQSVVADGEALRVHLSGGGAFDTDVVLSAIGLRPRTALAAAAGIAVNRGIVTNRLLATSAPEVYALGDCAEVEGQVLPFVMPLMQAARALAKTLAGTPTPVSYPVMPVVVKTPAAPAVVCPPTGGAGEWRLATAEDGVEARFEDAGSRVLGFALTGAATARKAALAKLVTPLFG